MVLSDWCFFPISKMPALYSAYVNYIESETNLVKQERESSGLGSGAPIIVVDPVLNKPITVSELKLASSEEATKYIQKYNNVIEEKKKEEIDGNEDDNKIKEKKVRSNKARVRRSTKKPVSSNLASEEKSNKNSERERAKKHK